MVSISDGDMVRVPSGSSLFTRRLRLPLLIAVGAGQLLSVLILIVDIAVELSAQGLNLHTVLEALATVSLIVGLTWTGYEVIRTLQRLRDAAARAEAALKLASGAFSDLLSQRFSEWGLTASEAEVALFTLKGFDATEIARLRGTAPGTVRAQLGRIYAKSDTHGRGEFVSLFLDALLETPVHSDNSSLAPDLPGRAPAA